MDTSRDALLTLLQLQRVDSTIDRLQARLAHLPEQAALDALEAKAQELDAQIAERQAVFDDVSTRQRRLDFEVDTLVQKIKAESGRLYSGVVNNAKELSVDVTIAHGAQPGTRDVILVAGANQQSGGKQE